MLLLEEVMINFYLFLDYQPHFFKNPMLVIKLLFLKIDHFDILDLLLIKVLR